MKKYFTLVMAFVTMIIAPFMVTKAETSNVAKIGDVEYATLEEAIEKAQADDTIVLIENADMTVGQSISKDLTIDLNGHNITAPSKVFSVENAEFVIEGKGMISENTADYAPIYIKGSTDKDAKNYTVVTIGSDVTLRGWSGIFVAQNSTNTAYGVVVNFNGKITNTNASGENYNFADASGILGAGIYVNGSIQKLASEGNVPEINLKGATINAQSTAIYAAGFAKWNIDSSILTGVESGIGAKAGIFTVRNSTIKAVGKSIIPPAQNNNGIEASGAALQLESNTGYAGNMEVTIDNSSLISENGVAICEYLVGDATETAVSNIAINGGTYQANDENYGVFALSDSFLTKHTGFITGGTFSSDVSKYVKAGYSALLDADGNFVVNRTIVFGGIYTISGKVTTEKKSVLVQLKQGGKVLQTSPLQEDGTYSFTKVAPGVYNIVAVNGVASTMELVQVKDKNVEVNLVLGNGNVKVVVSQKTPDVVVEGLEKVDTDKDVSLEVSTKEKEASNKEHSSIIETLKNKVVEFFNISLYVDEFDTKEINQVLKLVIPYDMDGKSNITFSRYHDGEVNQFEKLNSLPDGNYQDATYYVDKENDLVYVFTSKFSTYAIGYDEVATSSTDNPDTSDSILIYMIVGVLSFLTLITTIRHLKKEVL